MMIFASIPAPIVFPDDHDAKTSLMTVSAGGHGLASQDPAAMDFLAIHTGFANCNCLQNLHAPARARGIEHSLM
jgi:hypothetical protein